MVKLRAFKAYEGAGVIEIDHGKLVYIDFPYAKENEYECSPEQLERLVLRMDFEPTELEFLDGAAAVAFLRAKGNEGEDPFANESEEVILERFNSIGLENLEGIVDSIQEMYVDAKKYDQAILALERIASLRVVDDSAGLQIKVLRLLNHCRKEIDEVFWDIKRNPVLNGNQFDFSAAKPSNVWASALLKSVFSRTPEKVVSAQARQNPSPIAA
jgi:hypothetical protein